MSRNLIVSHVIAGHSFLQIFEEKHPFRNTRTLIVTLTKTTDNTITEVLKFDTTHLFEKYSSPDNVFWTLVSYYDVIIQPFSEKRLDFYDNVLEMIEFIATGDLHRIDDNHYFFKGNYSEESNPFDSHYQMNLNDAEFRISVGYLPNDLVITYGKFVTEDQEKLMLVEVPFECKTPEIIKAIRKYSRRVTMKPERILDDLKFYGFL